VVQIKLNNKAKYVELSVEDLRTGVRFPPSPPNNKNATFLGGFFIFNFP
jgi:hypothetical protein